MAEKKRSLHEILAVVGDLKGAKEKIATETIKTFGKPSMFTGMTKNLNMFAEERKQEETDEHQAMQTTVMEKLNYMKESAIRYWDAKFQKELGGQMAKADVIIDGTTLIEGLPVLLLLEMESELKELRKIYEAIPTLESKIDWEPAPDIGDGVYKSKFPVVSNKTEKTYEHKVIVPPTDKHPAQIREWTEDKPIGQYSTKTWSGMVNPAEKSKLLGKLDKILRAFKQARQRANKQELSKEQFASKVFDFIHSN